MKTFISNLPVPAVMDIIEAYRTGKNTDWFNSVDPETMEAITIGSERLGVTRRTLFNKVVSFYVKSKSAKVNSLIECLGKANEKALELSNHEDGGACNFDSWLSGWMDFQGVKSLKLGFCLLLSEAQCPATGRAFIGLILLNTAKQTDVQQWPKLLVNPLNQMVIMFVCIAKWTK